MTTATLTHRATALVFRSFLPLFAVLVACGGPSQPPSTGGADGRTAAVVPPATDAGALVVVDGGPASEATPSVDAGSAAGGSFLGNAKLCGCKLCEPKVSDDPCSTDADCAPASACHATSCIAASKVVPPTSRPICTRIMMCATTDANACTCYQGKCALTPRP